ncbi:MAG: alpha/beta hydrolase [Methanoculleus sp.]
MTTLPPAAVLAALRSGTPIPTEESRVPWIERLGCGTTAYRLTVPASAPCRTLLFFHAGGFTSCSTADHLDLCARLADAAGAGIVSVDYRLAPEHPFPAAVEDALSVYRYLLEGGCLPAQLVPVGISAGGTLVLSMLLAGRSLGLPMPAAAVLLSPVVDLLFQGESMIFNQETDWLTPDRLEAMRDDYLAGHDPSDPLASPLYADLEGLPPLFVQAGGGEVLIDGIRAFVETARLEGVPVTFDCVDGMFHFWQAFAGVLPEAAEAIERAGAFVQRCVPEEE